MMTNPIKILLAYDENPFDPEYFSGAAALPLGLGSIATYLRVKLKKRIEIKIVDATKITHKNLLKIIREFKPDLNGFNTTILNYSNSLESAREAKNQGSFVVFGGVNATCLSHNILKNREYIDAVIEGDGEIPFYYLVKKVVEHKDLTSIPNLIQKDKKGNIIEPKIILTPPLSFYPTIDYKLFDLEAHFKISNKVGIGNAVTIYSGKGCIRRAKFKIEKECPFKRYNKMIKKMPACEFCGRKDMGLRFFEDGKIKKLINFLYREKNVRYFWDVFDSYLPKNGPKMNVGEETYRFFFRLEEVTEKNLDLMKKRFGENLIFQVGVESGDQGTFDAMAKNENLTIEEIFNRLILLNKYNIKLDPSFVLGIEGETLRTLEETKKFIQKISKLSNLRWILVSPLTLLPDSPAFNKLLKDPEMNKKYDSKDDLDIIEMGKDYLERFTSITRRDIIENIKEIFEMIPKNIMVDSKGLTKEELKYVKWKRYLSMN